MPYVDGMADHSDCSSNSERNAVSEDSASVSRSA